MFLSFTLTLSVCLPIFLVSAILLTVAGGDRPQVRLERPGVQPVNEAARLAG